MNILNLIGDWIAGLGSAIGDMFSNISELLSSIVGIIPRGIVFLRSLFSPIFLFVKGIQPTSLTGLLFGNTVLDLCFYALVGFLIALGIRRMVTK